MFKRGLENMGKNKTERTDGNRIFDFWLDYDTEADVIFLDSIDNVPIEWVHPLFYDKAKHLIACGRPTGNECPICEYLDTLPKDAKDKPYARDVAFFSIIDLRSFKKEDGTVVEATKKVLQANKKTVEQITREMKSEGVEELRGSLWSISRGKDSMPKPAAVGDRYRFRRHPDLDKVLESYGKTEEFLLPFSAEEIMSLVVYDPEKANELFQGWLSANGKSAAPAQKSSSFKDVKLNF